MKRTTTSESHPANHHSVLSHRDLIPTIAAFDVRSLCKEIWQLMIKGFWNNPHHYSLNPRRQEKSPATSLNLCMSSRVSVWLTTHWNIFQFTTTHWYCLVELTWYAKRRNTGIQRSWIHVTRNNSLYETTVYELDLHERKNLPKIISLISLIKESIHLQHSLFWRKKN